jgi:2'-5' RNA ligase
MMASERLFFALWPADAQRRALTRVLRELPAHRGRESHPLDIHITLAFLGRVSNEQRYCVQQAAERARGVPFELVLDRIGCFPGARVLWCGADACPALLLDLVSSLTAGLEHCGFPPERRTYRPHATLVRNAVPTASMILERPVRWPVKGFVLAAGQGGPPPRYHILRRWSFSSS